MQRSMPELDVCHLQAEERPSRGSPAFTDQQKMNRVIDRLKNEAASLGANGILLEGVGDQAAGSVGTGFGTATANGSTAFGTGMGLSAGVFMKTGKGLAIYVLSP